MKTIEYVAFEDTFSLEKIVIPSSVFRIDKGAIDANVVIYTVEGSYAEQYAVENRIKYRIM